MGIVHHHGVFVCRNVIAVPYEEIAKVDACDLLDSAEISIHKRNAFAIWHAESPIHARWGGEIF
jgi:hypothetical protein